MSRVDAGDTVRVHYTGLLADDSIFDSSEGREPLQFVVGSGQVIAGFDQAVLGMAAGERKRVTIGYADAYGERREELLLQVARSDFPPAIRPEVGQQLQMNDGAGQNVMVTIAEVHADRVVLDANHPLAGKDLIFELELVTIDH